MIENEDNLYGDTDGSVSEIYRAIADERAPEYLNKAILGRAAKAARPRYLRSIGWTRPLAWAATITLTVALVLEVSNLPAPGPEAFDGGQLELQPPPSVGLPESAASRSTTTQSVQRELEKPLLEDGRHEIVRSGEAILDTANVTEPEIRDANMPGRTDAVARMRSAEIKEQVPATSFTPGAPVTAQKASGLVSAAITCDETARSSAESWHECVLQLQSAGFADEADRERKALQKAFPDFEPR